MLEDRSGKDGIVRRFWLFARRQVVQDVPAENALCEFDCRKGQCTLGEWEACDRRIRKGAGELFPDSPTPKMEGTT